MSAEIEQQPPPTTQISLRYPNFAVPGQTRNSSTPFSLGDLCDLSILAAVAPPAPKGQHASTKKRTMKRRRPRPDPDRFCEICFTVSTPEWRKGPSGAKSLCNACGLKWAKQVRDGIVSPPSDAPALSPSSSDSRMSVMTLLNSDPIPDGRVSPQFGAERQHEDPFSSNTM